MVSENLASAEAIRSAEPGQRVASTPGRKRLTDRMVTVLGQPTADNRAVSGRIGASTAAGVRPFGGDWSLVRWSFVQEMTIKVSSEATVIGCSMADHYKTQPTTSALDMAAINMKLARGSSTPTAARTRPARARASHAIGDGCVHGDGEHRQHRFVRRVLVNGWETTIRPVRPRTSEVPTEPKLAR
ncbi:hypothetical protein [Amycolatopsis taiwanensis]|uniref:hypothetical protein n=1 Tax=Amycolatopsis taiwanensis TaxID=342230 RepID=UPI0012EB1EA5|nr:hypothetical protein [Amycolatopsis taiwanensis]